MTGAGLIRGTDADLFQSPATRSMSKEKHTMRAGEDPESSAPERATAPTDSPKARHTPGPWTVHEIWPSGPGFSVTAEGRDYHIAGCGAYQHSHPGASFTDDECRANGRLIAAAPDLLAACKLVASFAQSWEPLTPGDIRVMLDAIAKAEGR